MSNRSPQRGDSGHIRFVPRGIGRGRDIRCFTCGEWGHGLWDCPHNKKKTQRNVNVVETKEVIPQIAAKEEPPEARESLLLRRILLKASKEAGEPA